MNAKTKTAVSQAKPQQALVHVNPAALVFDTNVRSSADSDIAELVQSVATYGVMQPITVQKTDRGYVVLYGHRRVIAAKLAGLASVPCLVDASPSDERRARQLVENLQRRDLKLGEAAVGLRKLYDEHGESLSIVAEMVGKSKSWACKMLALTANAHESKVALSLVLDETIADLEMAHMVAQIEKAESIDMQDLAEQIRAGQHTRETLRTILANLNGKKLDQALQAALPRQPMKEPTPTIEDLAACLNDAMTLLRNEAEQHDDKEHAAELVGRVEGYARVLTALGY